LGRLSLKKPQLEMVINNWKAETERLQAAKKLVDETFVSF